MHQCDIEAMQQVLEERNRERVRAHVGGAAKNPLNRLTFMMVSLKILNHYGNPKSKTT